jgi:hypothetical protein
METRINHPILKRLAMLLVPFLTVGAFTVAAHADKLAAAGYARRSRLAGAKNSWPRTCPYL